MWVPFFHKNLDYLETIGYPFGDFFSGGGGVQEGMVTIHPVGLPHGSKPAAPGGGGPVPEYHRA
jgi:homogentisate 1,2-dioxygenase